MVPEKQPPQLYVTFQATVFELEFGLGEYLCYIGGSLMLELAKNMGNLANELKVKIGSELTIQKVGFKKNILVTFK